MVAFGVIALLFAARSIVRTPDWDSTDSIMMAQLRDRSDSFRAHWHKARMERRDGKPQSAVTHYAHAVELWPYRERLVLEAAGYAAAQQQTRMAYRLSVHAAQQWPKSYQVQRLLAANALDVGDTITARQAVARALKMAPRDSLLIKISAAVNR